MQDGQSSLLGQPDCVSPARNQRRHFSRTRARLTRPRHLRKLYEKGQRAPLAASRMWHPGRESVPSGFLDWLPTILHAAVTPIDPWTRRYGRTFSYVHAIVLYPVGACATRCVIPRAGICRSTELLAKA